MIGRLRKWLMAQRVRALREEAEYLNSLAFRHLAESEALHQRAKQIERRLYLRLGGA